MTKEQFDRKYVGKNLVVNCETEKLAKEFLKLADEFGYRWSSLDSYSSHIYYKYYEKETCYELLIGVFGERSFYEEQKYTIVQFIGL